MPLLPPPQFDVPAIVQVAGHAGSSFHGMGSFAPHFGGNLGFHASPGMRPLSGSDGPNAHPRPLSGSDGPNSQKSPASGSDGPNGHNVPLSGSDGPN